jgi:hypothetical protein
MSLPTAPSSCRPAWPARLLSLASLLVVTGGCFSAGPLGHGGPAVTGSLALAGPLFGAREVAPVACHSGERQIFLGADFVEAEERADALTARLVVDPLSGPAVRIAASAAPFGPALLVHRANCAVFHFSLAQAGWRLNDYWVYTVSLELDCALPSGDGVAGKLLAPTCW